MVLLMRLWPWSQLRPATDAGSSIGGSRIAIGPPLPAEERCKYRNRRSLFEQEGLAAMDNHCPSAAENERSLTSLNPSHR
jgi:hypothetical protein